MKWGKGKKVEKTRSTVRERTEEKGNSGRTLNQKRARPREKEDSLPSTKREKIKKKRKRRKEKKPVILNKRAKKKKKDF